MLSQNLTKTCQKKIFTEIYLVAKFYQNRLKNKKVISTRNPGHLGGTPCTWTHMDDDLNRARTDEQTTVPSLK